MHRLWVTGETYDPFYVTKKKEQAKKKTAA